MNKNLGRGIFIKLKRIIISIYSLNYSVIKMFLTKHKFRSFGKRSLIESSAIVYNKSEIDIGDDTNIGNFVNIWAKGGLYIGSRVLIASHVSITTLSHDYTSSNMRFSKVISKSIVIEDDVWIGTHAVILPGVKIGKGAVVGAGAIVTKDVPAMAIVIGNPANIVKYRTVSENV